MTVDGKSTCLNAVLMHGWTCFSLAADKNKAFGAKRKWLESFTSSSLQMNQQKVRELWRSQQKARTQMSEDYCTQFSSVFQQWESDMQRSKDQDEKHMHQKMMFEQMRVSQGQRLRTLRQLVDHYVKSMQELQDTHKEQYTTALNELRQEMVLLQKEILMNTVSSTSDSIQQIYSSLFILVTDITCGFFFSFLAFWGAAAGGIDINPSSSAVYANVKTVLQCFTL
uniref:XLR/SYCP3/FAM9 domain-containing protein n=1 Tax=Electrophorus electricus TaxID=8005 RepID=A0AAY5EN50_ELEEL